MNKFDGHQEDFLRKAIKSGLPEAQSPGPAFADRIMRALPVAGSPGPGIVREIRRYRHFLWLLLIPMLGGLALLFLLNSNFVATYFPAFVWLRPYTVFMASALIYLQAVRSLVTLAFFALHRHGKQALV